MSYERRLEIEALPAEEGWGKWQAVIGYGTTMVERKNLIPLTIWVVGVTGPLAVEAYQYQRWRFAEQVTANTTKPADSRGFCYTRWHSNTDYTDYSPRATDLNMMCAETREELCRKVLAKLDGEIADRKKSLAILESRRANFE
ncbi:hypothetical protein [Hymenobacter glacieicola]|uniref:Uncharacterized protein n=1 Tax=Hymenobacter glacieicola TaxID=1562124 RepID=A0ABQ1WJF5_9BACT|nr:hypothetical protein [Hymenobacter glacieicola]GGG34122.1 hypothetical protein GCM10011378_08180 [Hymenobacter glacieicola]